MTRDQHPAQHAATMRQLAAELDALDAIAQTNTVGLDTDLAPARIVALWCHPGGMIGVDFVAIHDGVHTVAKYRTEAFDDNGQRTIALLHLNRWQIAATPLWVLGAPGHLYQVRNLNDPTEWIPLPRDPHPANIDAPKVGE